MEASAQQLKEIDLSLISVSGTNPRKSIKGDTFGELKDSIAEHGILEPLLVRPNGDDGYELVAGERRYTAAKELKLEMVPVSIRELDDAQARVLMLLENLQRVDLEPLEEASALEELLKTGDMTQQELARKLGKSQPWVANRTRLLKAPKELKTHLKAGDVTPQHIVALLPFVEREEIKDAVLEAVESSIMNYKDGFEPFTVDDARQVGEETVREAGYALDLSYHNSNLTKHFDYTGCDTCRSAFEVSADTFRGGRSAKEKSRYCLNGECFEVRLKAAAEKFQQAEAKKQAGNAKGGKAAVVPKGKLGYGDYKEIRSSEIDTAGCKGCPNYAADKEGKMTYHGEKGLRLCLNPSCYRGKISAKSRVRNKRVREAVIRTEEASRNYLQKREAGLTFEELRYVHKWIGDKVTGKARPKATRLLETPKDLEDSIIYCILQDELAPIRYSHDEYGLQQLHKHLPFKTPKAPKAKDKKSMKPKRKGRKGAQE